MAGPLDYEEAAQQARHVPLDQVLEGRPLTAPPGTAPPYSRAILIGVDVGKIHDPSAICVCRTEPRLLHPGDPLCGEYPDWESHFVCLGAERVPLGTSYPAVAARINLMVERLVARDREMPVVVAIDGTGVGGPVVDLCRERVNPLARVVSCVLTGGEKNAGSVIWANDVRISKVYLVSRLQALLQGGRIHLPRHQALQDLVEELKVFEIRTRKDSANPEMGSFNLQVNDDLCIALGLATIQDFADVRYDSLSFSSMPSPF